MNNYLTWSDFKRLIWGSFHTVLLYHTNLAALFKNQYCMNQYEEGIQKLHQETLTQFEDMPEKLKELFGYASLRKEEDGVHFRLDASLFLQATMYALELTPIDNECYFEAADAYYKGQREEYIFRIKEILKQMKRDCNSFIKKEGETVFFKNRDGCTCEIAKKAVVNRRNLTTWVFKHVEEILLKYEKEVPDSILDFIHQEKMLLLVTQWAFGDSNINGNREDDTIHREFFPFLRNYERYIQYRKKEDLHFNPTYTLKKRENSYGEGTITASVITEYLQKWSELNPQEHFASYGLVSDEAMLHSCLTDLKEKLDKEKEERKRKERLESFRKDIQLGWELLPSGQKGEGSRRNFSIHYKTEGERKELEKKKEQLLEEKISVFNDLPYIATLRGVNHLDGYVAYVFPNGKVIMEKFYKKTRNGLVPTYHEAIFVISIAYFGELSRESKTNIRDFIKSGVDSNAKVIHHFKNFKHKILMEIEDMEYNDKVVEYLETLVNRVEKPKELVKS